MKASLRVVRIALGMALGLQVGCGAAESLRAPAEKGDANAQLQLGFRYYRGEGVPEDHVEAAKWFRAAADQGLAQAQANVALSYAKGQGAPKDAAEAAKWYRQAADQGFVGAQTALGSMYLNGEGVPQDSAEALQWYRKAADQGDPESQHNLGFMYNHGEGVPQDYVEAYKWLTIAARGGLAKAEQYQRTVALEMSAAQIVEALRLSREFWLKKTTAEGDSGAAQQVGAQEPQDTENFRPNFHPKETRR